MKVVHIHVGGRFATSKRRVLGAVAPGRRGETHITLPSWSRLVETLTAKRLELLHHLRGSPAVSVAALARALCRNYRNVHRDVAALTAAGLIARDVPGLRADYDSIQITIGIDRSGQLPRKAQRR
jgi:predicted transcriptional regulator